MVAPPANVESIVTVTKPVTWVFSKYLLLDIYISNYGLPKAVSAWIVRDITLTLHTEIEYSSWVAKKVTPPAKSGSCSNFTLLLHLWTVAVYYTLLAEHWTAFCIECTILVRVTHTQYCTRLYMTVSYQETESSPVWFCRRQ